MQEEDDLNHNTMTYSKYYVIPMYHLEIPRKCLSVDSFIKQKL